MAPRKKFLSKIPSTQSPNLQPGDQVWAYLRHSPGDDQDIRSQRRGVDEFARQRGLVVAQYFVDEALTGATVERREAFEAMIAASRTVPPPVRAIIVWKLNRLARNELESQFFMADLRLRGYAIVSITDDIPAGEFASVVEAFVRWKDQRFLLDLQSDVMRGLDAVVHDRFTVDGMERTGFSCGGLPPRGYEPKTIQVGSKPSGKPILRTWWEKTANEDLRWRVELAWQIAIAAARSGDPIPVTEIHQKCRLYKELPSYYDFLKTATYCGARIVGKRRVDGAHEAYVSPEDFEMVQKSMPTGKLSPKTLHPRRVNSPFPLSGKVYCGYCGARIDMDRFNRYPNAAALRCSGRKRDSASCHLMRLSYATFMDGILGLLAEQVLTEERFAGALEEVNKRLSGSADEYAERRRQLMREISGVTHAIEQLSAAQEYAFSTTIHDRILTRERELAAKRAELAELAAEGELPKVVAVSPGVLRAVVGKWRADLASEDPEVLRRLLNTFIVRVEISNEDGRVSYTVPVEAILPDDDPRYRAMVRYRGGDSNP